MKLFSVLKYSFGKQETRGIRLRLTLETLGPIYVKFGQILASRRDLLPEDIANELVKLQDQVPPFSSTVARQIIKKSLGEDVDTLFVDFEDKPIGSASIAQVHGAYLKTGESVVIKLLRPNIEKQVKKDIRLITVMSNLAELFSPTLRKLGLNGAVTEFKYILKKELDLNYEVANASQLKRNMADIDWVLIPKVYWPYTRKNVAVFERIHAIRMSDKDALIANGIDLSLLASRTIELFFTAVFEHNFFHADMHAGNIFVEKTPDGIKYILVDFGIMGTLPTEDQRYLAENFSAFFAQDYDRVAQLHIASGWVPKDTRPDEFANAIRTVCEPIFSRKTSEISFAELFLRLLQTAKQFNMVILPQLMLLQKTLMNVEGLSRYLDPNIDIWDTAKPCLEKFFKQQSTFKLLRKQLRNTPAFINRLFALPDMLSQQKAKMKSVRKTAYQSFALGFICAGLIGIGYFLGI
ncbi:MAG: 2-polyprenylphenol 6-hydroxylase [Gammaproteobacteria bacterium]|jgi:ubiquinone biosynthesis protein